MSLACDTLAIIADNSLKAQDSPSKLVPFDSIRVTLQVNHKNMFLWLRNNLLFSKKRRFSCLSNMGHDILCMINDNSMNTQGISWKLVSSDIIRLTLQVDHKICILGCTIIFSYRRMFNFRALAYVILSMIDDYSLKTQDISWNLFALDSIRLTLQLDHRNIYYWLKNNHICP